VTLSLAQFFALTHHYRTTERLGNFVWASGSDDGRRWSEDANGVVTQSSNLFSEVDPFSVALRAPENPTGGVKLLGMTAGPSPQYVVEVTPSSGLVERRYYDAHSYLLARVERVDYDGHRKYGSTMITATFMAGTSRTWFATSETARP
jgi:hypothetical protein